MTIYEVDKRGGCRQSIMQSIFSFFIVCNCIFWMLSCTEPEKWMVIIY